VIKMEKNIKIISVILTIIIMILSIAVIIEAGEINDLKKQQEHDNELWENQLFLNEKNQALWEIQININHNIIELLRLIT